MAKSGFPFRSNHAARSLGMQPQAAQNQQKKVILNAAARWLVVFAMASTGAQALAQYVWTNEKGVRQYSDQPPPASVPDSRIIRGKNMPAATPPAAGVAPAGASAAPTAKPAAPSLTERNADFNKRRAQQAENDKKAAEEEKLAQQKKSGCERAANYKRTLESGARISRINGKGEQAVLNEEQRVQELREAEKALEACAS
jgi:hypothetical protein